MKPAYHLLGAALFGLIGGGLFYFDKGGSFWFIILAGMCIINAGDQ